jgi:hypothetical protein
VLILGLFLKVPTGPCDTEEQEDGKKGTKEKDKQTFQVVKEKTSSLECG